jgi:hypothetical protein
MDVANDIPDMKDDEKTPYYCCKMRIVYTELSIQNQSSGEPAFQKVRIGWSDIENNVEGAQFLMECIDFFDRNT